VNANVTTNKHGYPLSALLFQVRKDSDNRIWVERTSRFAGDWRSLANPADKHRISGIFGGALLSELEQANVAIHQKTSRPPSKQYPAGRRPSGRTCSSQCLGRSSLET
jgi:hypothetical protein